VKVEDKEIKYNDIKKAKTYIEWNKYNYNEK